MASTLYRNIPATKRLLAAGVVLLAFAIVQPLNAAPEAAYKQRESLKLLLAARAEDQRPRKQRAARQRSMSEAIAIAKSRVPGEVVSARKSISHSGRLEYRIKILSKKGVVRTVRVDGGG